MEEYNEELGELLEIVESRESKFGMSVAFTIMEEMQGQFMKSAPPEVIDAVINKLKEKREAADANIDEKDEDYEIEDVEEFTIIELLGGANLKKYFEANPNGVSKQLSRVIRTKNGESCGRNDNERLAFCEKKVHWKDGLALLQWIRDQLIEWKKIQKQLQGESVRRSLGRDKTPLVSNPTLQ